MRDLLNDLRARHEYVLVFQSEDLIIGVDKVGGGTLGRMYTGDWKVMVYNQQCRPMEDLKVTVGMPHDHKWVALTTAREFVE